MELSLVKVEDIPPSELEIYSKRQPLRAGTKIFFWKHGMICGTDEARFETRIKKIASIEEVQQGEAIITLENDLAFYRPSWGKTIQPLEGECKDKQKKIREFQLIPGESDFTTSSEEVRNHFAKSSRELRKRQTLERNGKKKSSTKP